MNDVYIMLSYDLRASDIYQQKTRHQHWTSILNLKNSRGRCGGKWLVSYTRATSNKGRHHAQRQVQEQPIAKAGIMHDINYKGSQ